MIDKVENFSFNRHLCLYRVKSWFICKAWEDDVDEIINCIIWISLFMIDDGSEELIMYYII